MEALNECEYRMRIAFAIQLISVLLMFLPNANLSTCIQADWEEFLEWGTLSTCPKTNTYLKGLWRNQLGDGRFGRIENGWCCPASEPSYANQNATCLIVNWPKYTLDDSYGWALCPSSYYLNGLLLDLFAGLPGGQCCHPQNHPNSYELCYDEDVSHSFNHKSWSTCKQQGYYMAGFNKSYCSNIYLSCIEKIKCCKMEKVSPKVQLLGPNWTMREGDRLNLTCIIKAGLPKPQVSWYKDKILLVGEESTSLFLEELTDKDEGQYKCEARNPFGVADAIINVTVDN